MGRRANEPHNPSIGCKSRSRYGAPNLDADRIARGSTRRSDERSGRERAGIADLGSLPGISGSPDRRAGGYKESRARPKDATERRLRRREDALLSAIFSLRFFSDPLSLVVLRLSRGERLAGAGVFSLAIFSVFCGPAGGVALEMARNGIRGFKYGVPIFF
ncbi:hypothetical protein NL676_018031 [Syzygium grande]|nr:hypothetical protein NL676_018031 [Syzygium grande]